MSGNLAEDIRFAVRHVSNFALFICYHIINILSYISAGCYMVTCICGWAFCITACSFVAISQYLDNLNKRISTDISLDLVIESVYHFCNYTSLVLLYGSIPISYDVVRHYENIRTYTQESDDEPETNNESEENDEPEENDESETNDEPEENDEPETNDESEENDES